MRVAALLGLLLTLAKPAGAQVPPAPDAGAPEGAVRTAHEDAALDSYALPVAPYGRDAEPARRLEGRVTRAAYRLTDGEATPAQVIAGYRERLAAKGFRPVFSCQDRDCGGFDFRFGIEILPAPAMLMDTADFAQLSMEAPGGRYASVLASRVLGTVYVQAVTVRQTEPVAAAEPAATAEAPPGSAGLPQDGLALAAALRRDGQVALEGLAFEPGGAVLSDGSAAALDRVARILKAEDGLKLAVVGHSDTQGALDANRALSRRRAEAVRDALVARGVSPDRLEAHGVGWLAPVASNATEQGRQRNRRVALVLK